MADNKPNTPDPAAVLAQREADEKLIREKIAKGLTREQAETVVRNQKKFAEANAKLQQERDAARKKAAGAEKK